MNERYAEFPNIINVEVFRGICPCSCIHCPVGQTPRDQRSSRFGVREIELDLFKKLVREISQYSESTLRLHSVGDPLHWSKIGHVLQYSREKKVRTWLFTCLVTTDHDLLKQLCRYADIVEVSVNSTNRVDYCKTKGIDAFQVVHENIRYMSNYIKRNKLDARLLASRVQSNNKAEDQAFADYWINSGLVADAFVRTYHSYNSLIEDKGAMAKTGPCLVHWMRFNIGVNGIAVSCFNELFHKAVKDDVIIADLHELSIHEAWRHRNLNRIRLAELTNSYNQFDFDETFPCINCNYCQPIDNFKNNKTSENQIKTA